MLRPARFAGHRAVPVLVPVLLASFAVGPCLAAAPASAATAIAATPTLALAPSPSLEATTNPFGLPRVINFRIKPASGIAITVGCTGTSTQPCTGTIFAGTAETLQGKRVVAVTSSAKHAAKGKQRAIRIAQAPFSLAGGQTATIQMKLNSTGLKLLRRFHAISAYVLAGEVIPQGKFVFLAREVLFKTPVKHK